jgi:hexulose-6-phosphate isomerase
MSGAALALAAAAPLMAAKKDKGEAPGPKPEPVPTRSTPRPFKKAVMFHMIKDGNTVAEKFQVLKECGFDGVEMDSPTTLDRNEIKAASEKTGIIVEGEVCSTHWKQTLSHNDLSIRAAGLKGVQTAIQDCAFLGGTSVLVVPCVVDKSVSYDDAWKRSQEEIRKCIPMARDLNVKLAIENVWNHFIISPLEACRYVDEFEAPDVMRWHFDIGNMVFYGWPEQWARILNKRVFKLHFKEYSRTKAAHEGQSAGFGVEFLEGDNDWPAVMKALDDIGYNTWACAEVNGGDRERLKFIAGKMDTILRL